MNRRPTLILLFIFLLLLDQISKMYILKIITPGDMTQLIGNIYITNIRNINTEFSSNQIRIIMQIIIPIIIMFFLGRTLITNESYTKVQKVAMWILASGGFGNLIDRVVRSGGVVDFIYIKNIYFLPVFNIADLSVAIGSIIMILSLILSRQESKK
ncbi:MAG: signal peptidase II [Spirochaetaceae bacterium 4572_7]|nr:MAG: signal peptidase II [Spirochaetaceae bacterium 4572_7]